VELLHNLLYLSVTLKLERTVGDMQYTIEIHTQTNTGMTVSVTVQFRPSDR